MPIPAVLQDPDASAGMKRGFDTLARLLALTLGPTQGVVVMESFGASKFEALSDASTIARRMLALPDRVEDVGAMLLRNLVWRTHLAVGDGTATAAVLSQAILNHAHRYQVAGANAMALRHGIELAVGAAAAALGQMARPIEDEEEFACAAQTITAEPDLGRILGEMFYILGPDAHITIQDYVAPYLEREYHEGGRWGARLASRYFVNNPVAQSTSASACHVAIYDGALVELEDVQPILELITRVQPGRLLLVARAISGVALSTLVLNHQRNTVEVIAVELHRPGLRGTSDCEDLAVLTGTRVFSPATGSGLRGITASDLGTLRRVEIRAEVMAVVGDEGHSAAVRRHIETLRVRMAGLPEDDEARSELHFRLARLAGQAGTLKIGASTEAEQKVLRQKAEKGVRALPIALREGVIPGGGVAYLNCIPTVRRLSVEGEAALGVEVLACALEAPFLRIVYNAGEASPRAVLCEARRLGTQYGYDVLQRQIVRMEAAGILDAAGVLRWVLETAASGAVMALTTEAIVLKRRPRTSAEP